MDTFPDRVGRYELIERLGSGGMAEVFKARYRSSHGFEKTLVLKCLLPDLADKPEFIDMFVTEARIMAQLDHPNVVQVLDFGEANGRYFIAMEYVNGMDLKRILALSVRRRRRPPTAVALFIVGEVLKALDFAHRRTDANGLPLRIVHRDISPSNIFVSELAEVKLSDFGIAKATTRTEKSQVGEIKGKYGYVAPEMISGAAVDSRADIFSAGVVLAELLIVRRLFLGKTDLDTVLMLRDVRLDRLHDYGQHIPADLMQILESALAKDPNTRYQDAAAFGQALRGFLFNRRLMVQDTDLRAFVQSLHREPTGESPANAPATTSSLPQPQTAVSLPGTAYSLARATGIEPPVGDPGTAAPAPLSPRPPDHGRPDHGRLLDVVHLAGAPITAAEGETNELRLPGAAIGRKRKITLTPPPRPVPISPYLSQTGERSVLSTEHAIAAVRELESPRATPGKVRLASEVSRSLKADPVDLDRIAASRMTSSDEEDGAADRRGSLEHTSLFRVIFDLAVAEETGLLVLRSTDAVKEVFLVDGDPRHVSSNRADELFGQFLVGEGVIDEQQLSLATAMLPYFKGRLGDSLVGLQLLSAIQVARYLTKQVREKLLSTFLWDGGEYVFFAGRQCEQESAQLGWDGFEVLGAAIRAMPAETARSRLQPRLGRRFRAADAPPTPPEVFRLGPAPRQALEQLARPTALGQLLDGTDPTEAVQRETLCRVLYLLIETGLVISAD